MRLANGIVIDKEKTFGVLKFSALRREVHVQNEDGTVSEEIKERTYDLKCNTQGRMIQVSVPATVPLKDYENMAKQAVVRVFNAIMTRAGITLIVTVAFSISSMFYNISTDYPFFMVAFLQIICFAGIYMKLGELMSMFSLNANDSQQIGRRIFRRPMVFMRHRARRMERRIARAVGTGSMVGAGAGAVAGSAYNHSRSTHKNTPARPQRNNDVSMGSRVGSAVGAVMDTKNKVRDSASSLKENVKALPTQAGYAVHSAKQKAKDNVSDFKRGVVEERENRQEQRTQKRNLHRENISQKKQELQKAQGARQTVHANGSATAGATRSHERPVATPVPKPAQNDTHVGIYVGNNQMYHAGNPIGYTDLTSAYWQQHIICAGRIKQ